MENNKKKKILFVDHDPGLSGSTISMNYLISEFIHSGFNVFVLTKKNPAGIEYLKKNDVNIIKYSSSLFKSITMLLHFSDQTSLFTIQWIKNLFKDLLSFVNGVLLSIKIILKYKPDIIYINEYVTIQFGIFAKIMSIPVLVHIRSRFIDKKFSTRRYLLKKTLRLIPVYKFAISQIEAEQIVDKSEGNSNVIVIPEFLNENDFSLPENIKEIKKKFQFSENEKVVIFLGGIHSIKGSIDFITSIKYIKKNLYKTVFILAGKIVDHKTSFQVHSYYKLCMDAVNQPEIKPYIRVMGEIENVHELISISDIIVSTSTVSHFSRPIIEAWALKKPVIATNSVHSRNLIDDGINGIIIPVNSPIQLAKAIEQLLSDNKLCLELGKHGYEKVKGTFDSKINTKKIIDYCIEYLG